MADGDEHKRRRMKGQFTSEVPQTNTNIFSFGLNACKLKRALAPIVDGEFNPRGLARLDVDSFGIEFTVHNVTTQVTARLKLKHGFLDGFFFSVPETATPRSYKLGNVVNVNNIAEILKHFDDDEVVNVCCRRTHLSGDKHLFFSSKKDPSRNQSVLLGEPDVNYEYLKFSRFYSREVEIPKKQLSFIVDRPLQAGKPRRVLIDVRNHSSIVVVGEDNTEKYIDNVQGGQGQFEGALFDWTHVESLQKASLLDSKFYLRILIGREPNGILLRFNLVGLGELHYYLSESVRVFGAADH